MNNTISLNYMSRQYSSFLKFFETKEPPKTAAFGEMLACKSAEGNAAAETGKAGIISTEEMTMEEYRQYIHDRISQIPIHPSQMGWQWNIEITDSGFEAMKNNPDYEKYVLNAIRSNFSFADPFHSRNYSVLHFGASEEESYGKSWGFGNPVMEKSEDSFWERRVKRHKKLEEQYEELQEKKILARRIAKEKYNAQLAVRKAEGKPLPPFLDEEAYLARSIVAILEDVEPQA